MLLLNESCPHDNISCFTQKHSVAKLLPTRHLMDVLHRLKLLKDIIIKNKKEKTCTLIDVAVPTDRSVVQKEAEKKLKYKSLCTEIQRMWNLKCMILAVIIGATGIVMRSLRKNLEAV